MPNPSTYPYRRFPTIQVGAADHAARGTDAVKQELHALCAGSSKTVVTVECYLAWHCIREEVSWQQQNRCDG